MPEPAVDAPAGFVPIVAISFGQTGNTDVIVDGLNPLPVAVRATTVTYTDRSSVINAGGTAQQLVPANPARRGFFVQNVSGSDLWINSSGSAVAGQPTLRIAAGQLYECPVHGVPAAAISILSTTTEQQFSAREW